jgi:hypothetical protein
MKQLEPTRLFTVKVPIDAIGFKIRGFLLTYTSNGKLECIPLNTGKHFEILGTVTKDEISFDVNPHVKSNKIKQRWDDSITTCYLNYLKKKDFLFLKKVVLEAY